MSALQLVRYGAWATIALIGAIMAYVLLMPRPPEQAAVAGRIGGPFVLPAHTGETVDSRQLAGRPFAVFFGFTQCPDVCPTTMLEVGTVLKELEATRAAEAARAFRVYFVTVDPERDTAALLRDYLSAFDSRIIGLLPTVEQLPALTRQFAAYYRKVPTSTGYTMDHTSAVYLFDARGQFVGTLDVNETRANQIAKVTRLLTR
jgi:protein SCO1/2